MSTLRKNICAVALFVITTFSSAVYAQDACVNVIGNLVAGLNCGFDDNVSVAPWNPVVGTLTIGSATPSPGGTNYGIINPTVRAFSTAYSIQSGLFNLAPNTPYQLSFFIKGTTSPALVDIIQILSASGPSQFTLQTNLAVGSADWTQLSYIFTTGATVDPLYRLQLDAALPNPGAPASISIDSLVLVAVPEPATMILLGSLCSAVVGYKWKKKQSLVS
jgi:hypothetical protein